EEALAAWRALPAQSRRRAWQAAAKPEPIDDPELAAVVARYATAMRSQVPAAVLVVALAALFGWLAVAIFWLTHGRSGVGIVLAAIGVVAAGLGIGAVQVRQANYDRLFACAVTGPAGMATLRRGRRTPLMNVGGSAGSRRSAEAEPLRGGKVAGLPDRQQAEQQDRTDEDADLDGGAVGPRRVRDARPDERPDDQATEVAVDRDAPHGEREDHVDHDDRQHGGGTQP